MCCSIYLQQTGEGAEHETEPCGRLGHAEEESERLMDQQVGHFREARVAKSLRWKGASSSAGANLWIMT